MANISHEIRTPMNGVLGVAEILDHSPLSDRQRQLLQALRQSGADMMVIINDLLNFIWKRPIITKKPRMKSRSSGWNFFPDSQR